MISKLTYIATSLRGSDHHSVDAVLQFLPPLRLLNLPFLFKLAINCPNNMEKCVVFIDTCWLV